VGCLRCQLSCPENKEVRDRRAPGEAFTADETSALLAATALERLPAETRVKLERSGLAAFYDILPRNLAAIRARR
jgi:epoxyqueuosine reductase